MEHLNGTLLEHLMATEELLRSWDSPEDLCLAGLCHAAYGTDGFAPCLVSWHDRDVLVRAIGAAAEEKVYLYASCDRDLLYPQLSGAGPVMFRDRFLSRTLEPTDDQLQDFVDLTLANELEIAISGRTVAGTDDARSPSELPPWIVPLVGAMERRASPGVRRGSQRILLGEVPVRP
jgi:hypothetical protein